MSAFINTVSGWLLSRWSNPPETLETAHLLLRVGEFIGNPDELYKDVSARLRARIHAEPFLPESLVMPLLSPGLQRITQIDKLGVDLALANGLSGCVDLAVRWNDSVPRDRLQVLIERAFYDNVLTSIEDRLLANGRVCGVIEILNYRNAVSVLEEEIKHSIVYEVIRRREELSERYAADSTNEIAFARCPVAASFVHSLSMKYSRGIAAKQIAIEALGVTRLIIETDIRTRETPPEFIAELGYRQLKHSVLHAIESLNAHA